MPNLNQTIDRSLAISRGVTTVLDRRMKDAAAAYVERTRRAQASYATPLGPANGMNFQQAWRDWCEYGVDFAQRSVLFWDTIRERGNNWIAHEAAGKPPVLAYRYEVLSDGRRFERVGDKVPGSPEAPLSWDAIVAKFRDCASVAARPIAQEKIEQAQERARNLESLDDATMLLKALTQ